MKGRFFNSKRGMLFFVLGLLILLAVAVLIIPYPYSQLFEKKNTAATNPTTIDTRYMSEVTGIDTPEDMQRQYNDHPEELKFALEDDFVVMFAYPDSDIRWTGMVFIHHFSSVSEVVLDYDGNIIYEQITSPEVQAHMNSLVNDDAFIARLQNQMTDIWDLNDPGVGVMDLVDSLQASGIDVEFLGGQPQTLFDASMFIIRVNDQDISVFEFDDKAARRAVSDHISADGYEYTQKDGENMVIIHIEYLDQPNFWAKQNLLVQYLGTNQDILNKLTAELGDPLTTQSIVTEVAPPPSSIWQTYSNPYFRISIAYPSHWEHIDGDGRSGEKFSGDDGYFTITAMGDVGLTLDQAVQAEIQHKLQPYGPDPLVEELQIQGQEARLISPSVSQTDNLRWQAALLVLYPQPISLSIGDREHDYPILALYGDPAHIREIADSLQFDVEPFEELETNEMAGGDLACLAISEIPVKVYCPTNYSLIPIKEQNRRGSFAAYRFQVDGDSQTPSLMEIQFFSAESIETFISNCGEDLPCFFGSYPNPELFADLKAAFEEQTSYQDYSPKMFANRFFLVKNIPCHGFVCTIREYITFFGDVMSVIWVSMEDEIQSNLSDQLFNQVIFVLMETE